LKGLSPPGKLGVQISLAAATNQQIRNAAGEVQIQQPLVAIGWRQIKLYRQIQRPVAPGLKPA
jgi:hypothetical protein